MNRITVSLLLLAPALLAQESSDDATARTYLKQAQLLMRVQQQPNIQLTLKPADSEIQSALEELGSHTGGKDIAEHPGTDTRHLSDVERFRSIVDLLHAARTEISQEKITPPTANANASALRHIASALEAVHRAAVDAHLDREIGSF